MELQLKYLSSVLDTAGRLSVDIPPANEDDIRLRRVVALYHNLTAPLRPDPFLNIIHNFRLAAAMLGWYFEACIARELETEIFTVLQGKFALPPSLEELLIHFKMHGLAKEVTDDEPELRRVFSDDKRKMEDFVKPIKLCLFISPFTLLIPWAYWKWAFSDAQLVEIFFCLGSPKPREVEYCEQAIMQVVNDIADGRKFAERAILELLDDLGTKGELLHQEGVKNWFQSQGGFVMNLNSAIQRLREVDSEQAEEQRLITPNVLSTNTSSSLLNTGENADNSQNEDGRSRIYGGGFSHQSLSDALNFKHASVSGDKPGASQLKEVIENEQRPASPPSQELDFQPQDWSESSPFSNELLSDIYNIEAHSHPAFSSGAGASITIDPKLLQMDLPLLSTHGYHSFPLGLPKIPFESAFPSEFSRLIAKAPAVINNPDIDVNVPADTPEAPEEQPPILGKRLRNAVNYREEGNGNTPKPRKKKGGKGNMHGSSRDDDQISDSEGDSHTLKKKKTIVEETVSSSQQVNDDNDIFEIPFIDLTGDDELRRPQMQKFSVYKRIQRHSEPSGVVIISCYNVAKKESILKYNLQAFVTDKTMNKVAREIQDSFYKSFILGQPRYYQDTATDPTYNPGCSIFFVTTREDWLRLSLDVRQCIFERRHIIVKGLMPAPQVQMDLDGFELMGVTGFRILPMHDIALAQTSDPKAGLIMATAQDFLDEVQKGEKGTILDMMSVSIEHSGIPEPEGYLDLNTSGHAMLQTQSLNGCQWLGPSYLDDHLKWGAATIAGAVTPVYANKMATMVTVKAGAKMWYATKGISDTIHGLDQWDPNKSCTNEHSFEGALIEADDVLFIRPGVLNYNITISSCFLWGAQFHSISALRDSIWAHIHLSILDMASANVLHVDNAVFLIQIQAFWLVNLKRMLEGQPPGVRTQAHIPNIQSQRGFLDVLCLGNLIIFLESLDYRNYLDLTDLTPDEVKTERERRANYKSQLSIARATFADFQMWFMTHYDIKEDLGKWGIPQMADVYQDVFLGSVVHLAVQLVHYKRKDHNVKPRTKQWTAEAFEIKVQEALAAYPASDSHTDALLTVYNDCISDPDEDFIHLSGGGFLPEWGNDFSIVLRTAA
ncbi:hypothetical protein C8R43DRAFT_1141783 [Mycena crocata]|nr:hypothetical protein C8R43DRAFT_1141783 [Mycena crocata]